jgi:signal transduction histidine kinase
MAEDDFLIEVTDWGRGIPADEKPKIFSPFFTTRKGGTGLGLPIAGKIIEAHRGSIEVLDNPEGGTIFRLRIPAR